MKGHINIESIYAFVVRDDDGTEGIVGALGPHGWIPLVGADMEKVQQLEPRVQMTANATGKTIQLVRFKTRRLIKTIEPNRLAPGKAVRLDPGGDDSIIGIV